MNSTASLEVAEAMQAMRSFSLAAEAGRDGEIVGQLSR